MAEEGVRIEGLNTLVRTLDKASEEISLLKDAHAKAGDIVAAEAETIAPRRSGALAGTIKAARQARRARVQTGRAKVPYAGPIHWGWPARGIEPQPFLSDAARNTETRWTAQYREDVQRALDNVKGA
jgi:hypothetical protein